MYMGKDKYENEDLIKYGIPEDFWFHVDDLSSAHVYLRLRKNQRLEDVSEETIMECAQLVKANSIEGCKKKEVYVVYTRWRNLLKTNNMVAGQVSYHDKSKVKRMKVVKDNSIVNALNRTKTESFPDLAALQEARAAEHRAELKAKKRADMAAEQQAREEAEEAARLRSYESLMHGEMKSNADLAANLTGNEEEDVNDFEDDFM